MDKGMRSIIVSIIVNSFLSWMVLPLFFPPFRMYSLAELLEVLVWQGIGTVGWPLALLFGMVNALYQRSMADLGTLLAVLIYPSILYLFIRIWRAKQPRRWEFVLLHLLITGSFAVVWYKVLTGYEFMAG